MRDIISQLRLENVDVKIMCDNMNDQVLRLTHAEQGKSRQLVTALEERNNLLVVFFWRILRLYIFVYEITSKDTSVKKYIYFITQVMSASLRIIFPVYVIL